MGEQIFTGRYTTENEEDIVVFIFGMRINNWLAVHQWIPAFASLSPLMKELQTHQKMLGLLSMERFYRLRTVLVVQYWRSMGDLLAYARRENHLTAWRDFNRKVGNNPAVGLFHESYQVKKKQYESVYGNMPLHGLRKALPQIPITNDLNGANKRLNKKPESSLRK